MNTWPDGVRRGLFPSEHEKWNATQYPGTRQLCCLWEEPTERCEEDSIYTEEEGLGPLCSTCYGKRVEDDVRSTP